MIGSLDDDVARRTDGGRAGNRGFRGIADEVDGERPAKGRDAARRKAEAQRIDLRKSIGQNRNLARRRLQQFGSLHQRANLAVGHGECRTDRRAGHGTYRAAHSPVVEDLVALSANLNVGRGRQLRSALHHRLGHIAVQGQRARDRSTRCGNKAQRKSSSPRLGLHSSSVDKVRTDATQVGQYVDGRRRLDLGADSNPRRGMVRHGVQGNRSRNVSAQTQGTARRVGREVIRNIVDASSHHRDEVRLDRRAVADLRDVLALRNVSCHRDADADNPSHGTRIGSRIGIKIHQGRDQYVAVGVDRRTIADARMTYRPARSDSDRGRRTETDVGNRAGLDGIDGDALEAVRRTRRDSGVQIRDIDRVGRREQLDLAQIPVLDQHVVHGVVHQSADVVAATVSIDDGVAGLQIRETGEVDRVLVAVDGDGRVQRHLLAQQPVSINDLDDAVRRSRRGGRVQVDRIARAQGQLSAQKQRDLDCVRIAVVHVDVVQPAIL